MTNCKFKDSCQEYDSDHLLCEGGFRTPTDDEKIRRNFCSEYVYQTENNFLSDCVARIYDTDITNACKETGIDPEKINFFEVPSIVSDILFIEFLGYDKWDEIIQEAVRRLAN